MRRLLVFLLGACGASVLAQTYVVAPNIYENAEAPSNLNSLIRNLNNPRTQQLIMDSGQLTGLVGLDITGVTYRLSLSGANFTYPGSQITWSDYEITLGASVDPSVASLTYANNWVGSPTLVRSGSLTVQAGAWPYDGNLPVQVWGVEIQFDTPFAYSGGDLALMVSHTGSDDPNVARFLDATGTGAPGFGTDYTRIGDSSFQGTSGFIGSFTVMRLTAVPEPATMLILAGGLALLAAKRRKKQA